MKILGMLRTFDAWTDTPEEIRPAPCLAIVASDCVTHVDGHAYLIQGDRTPIHRVGEVLQWTYAGAWS